MTRRLVMALVVSLSAAPLIAETPAKDVDALAWMQGTWAGEKDGVAMEEIWTSPRGGAMLGMHSDVKGGRLAFWEFFRIQADEKGVVYYASPRSAPPTPFRLVESGDKRVVFENKANDFPQRILYWIEGGALRARIEGPQKGKTVSEEWTWSRVK